MLICLKKGNRNFDCNSDSNAQSWSGLREHWWAATVIDCDCAAPALKPRGFLVTVLISATELQLLSVVAIHYKARHKNGCKVEHSLLEKPLYIHLSWAAIITHTHTKKTPQ